MIEDNEKAVRDITAVNDQKKKGTDDETGTKTKKTIYIFADEKKCEKKHPGIPCAANDGPHYPCYLDSGPFVKKCDSCKALLLAKESSSLCCRLRSLQL